MRRSSSSLSTISLLRTLYLRHFSTSRTTTTTTTNTLPSLPKTIPLVYKSHALQQSQQVLTEYFRNKRVPFTYVQQIINNSTYTIYETISNYPFSFSDFRYKFRKFIRHNPINDFAFFYESIGIDYLNIPMFLKPNVRFFKDDCIVLDAACCFAEFGFHWNKLGRLYVEDELIFRQKPEILRRRLDGLVSLGFGKQQVFDICVAFPGLLKEEEYGLDSDYDALWDDLKRVFLDFGFPLDKLFVKEFLTSRKKLEYLRGRLDRLASSGFCNQESVGICLVFSGLLKEEEEGRLDCDFDALLDDLKKVFLDFDLGSSMAGNRHVLSEVCEKVKVFYELGVTKGEFGKLIAKDNCIFTGCPMEVLVEKVEFFSRLGVEKSEVGDLILSNPKILSIKFEDRVISISSFLEHFGLCKEKMLSVEQNYKYVFGRNKMVNLPIILRAMDLHEWFFDRMKGGYYELFSSYDLSSPDDGLDENYVQSLESPNTVRKHKHLSSKLKFFHGIGFGENGFTVKLLASSVNVLPSELQERFDFLLSEGIEFSKLCKMMSLAPKVFHQEINSLEKKTKFLVQEIGLPLDHLETFPTYLQYNLEEHIKPRYKFHVWLTDQGLCTKKYTLSTIIGKRHKAFLSHLTRIHPSAPQLWMEQYGNKEVD